MRRLFALLALLLPLSSLAAQDSSGDVRACELHIWSTGNVHAVDKSNSMDGTGSVVSNFWTNAPLKDRLQRLVTAEFQKQALQDSGQFDLPALANFELVWHDEPSPQQNWTDKAAMNSWGRHSDSEATCYAEIHGGWFTFLDQPLKDVLQNGWMLRYFGDADLPKRWGVEGGYTRSGRLAWATEAERSQTSASLAGLMGENFRKFLTRRKIKRILKDMEAGH